MSFDEVGKTILGLVSAAVLGSFGWLWRTENRVTVLETQLSERHTELKDNLREIKDALGKLDDHQRRG